MGRAAASLPRRLVVRVFVALVLLGGLSTAQASPNKAISQTSIKLADLIENEPVWQAQDSHTWTWREEDAPAVTPDPSQADGSSGGPEWRPWRHDWTINLVSGGASTGVQGPTLGGPNNGVSLGKADASASGSVGLENHGSDVLGLGLRVRGTAKASSNLVDARSGGEVLAGNDDRAAGIGARLSASLGADARSTGDVQLNRRGLGAKGKLQAFVGAKATGAIPVNLVLCGLQTMVAGTAQVSAGAGAKGDFAAHFDWRALTLELGAGASATLGLGAGLGAKVRIDAGALVNDPKAVWKCLQDQLASLGRLSQRAGGWLVDQARRLAPLKASDQAVPLDDVVQDLDDVLGGVLSIGC